MASDPAPELGTLGTSAQIYSSVEAGQQPHMWLRYVLKWLPHAQLVDFAAVKLLVRDASAKRGKCLWRL